MKVNQCVECRLPCLAQCLSRESLSVRVRGVGLRVDASLCISLRGARTRLTATARLAGTRVRTARRVVRVCMLAAVLRRRRVQLRRAVVTRSLF